MGCYKFVTLIAKELWRKGIENAVLGSLYSKNSTGFPYVSDCMEDISNSNKVYMNMFIVYSMNVSTNNRKWRTL